MAIADLPNPTPIAQVLIVEDEPDHADTMAEALRKPGHVCTIVGTVAQAMEELKGGAFDVIVTDLRMPSSGGHEAHGGERVDPGGANAGLLVLKAARALQPDAETVMVTAHGDVATARGAFKEGAYDFIEKPLDLAVFRSLINRAAEAVLLRHESGPLSDLVQHDGFEGLIAGSEPMRRIIKTVRTVAPSTIAVLITGESGTGKELIAGAVHKNSPRANKRYVAFNCAGQSESLLEDQLFGHVRGAFTGADKDREGVFEYASGGTLFLDEIGDMPLPMQAKLLRVLETGEVVRLGSNDARKTDVRFVSATNKDLRQMIAQGTFREDLYFRINGASIHVPPLRERREDIPRIAQHAAARFADQMKQPTPEFTDAALMRLTACDWPGNVRQLLNVVQNMVVVAIGQAADGAPPRLEVRHIPADIRAGEEDAGGGGAGGDAGSGVGAQDGGAAGSLAGTSLEQLEKRAIRETLRLTGGNREQAAKLLGIGERTLYRKLREYGLR
ncbi:MAG: sigma-54-dependent Fis family transcriptional regulator [Phycisphaeraceae bacterium]|nr:sigma-54-dependent Fis family transcriptional regulator [Phycisphaeraceae bacterium]